MPQPTFSFEFFPPKTDAARVQFWKSVNELAALNPAFLTVTYGAGGSTRTWTMQMAVSMQSTTGIPTASHLTCVNTEKDSIREIAWTLWNMGIKHIVALRGDVPAKDLPLDYTNPNYYHYADELVRGLKGLYDFEISVAAYPEKHPEAPDLDTDIENLKRKCETGVARAITQFFFDNDSYFRFVEKARKAGITTPIVPGILPIGDFERMLRFAQTCQAGVPDWLKEKFAPLKDKPKESRRLAEDLLIQQVRGLIGGGVDHIHFYALNRSDLIRAAIDSMDT